MSKTGSLGATPLVSETLLKNRRTLDELAYRRSITVEKQVKRKRVVRGEDVHVKRAEQFVRERRIKEGSEKKMQRRKRQAEKRTKTIVPKASLKKTVGLVVRIHEGRHTSQDIKSSLNKLGLKAKYNAVFMKLDEATITQLKALDAYVAYGFVSHKSVIELVHRRASTKLDGKAPTPLADNLTVEKALGDKGILCLNDLTHEIYNVGENFEAAKNVLCTFALSAPVGHYEKKVFEFLHTRTHAHTLIHTQTRHTTHTHTHTHTHAHHNTQTHAYALTSNSISTLKFHTTTSRCWIFTTASRPREGFWVMQWTNSSIKFCKPNNHNA